MHCWKWHGSFRINQDIPEVDLGHPNRRSNVKELPPKVLALFDNMAKVNRLTFKTNERGIVRWDHLIYAYMIENTRCYDIFYRVLEEFLYGEKLGVPTEESYQWLRNTEALFFSDPHPFAIYSIKSHIRPDMGKTRRNAYYRMFGMDLNHGDKDGKPANYPRPENANTNFGEIFREFCEEVWIGIENVGNTSGVNRTDTGNIAYNAKQLYDMFRTRRLNAEISRVEFFSVAMLSWFHLTLQFNSPIVNDMRAEASNPEQRLFKIAQKVGMPAHALSENFFRMADALSRIFTQIELGTFNDSSAVEALFDPASEAQKDMRLIITHWSNATGLDMKVRRGQNTSQLISKSKPVMITQPTSSGNGKLVTTSN